MPEISSYRRTSFWGQVKTPAFLIAAGCFLRGRSLHDLRSSPVGIFFRVRIADRKVQLGLARLGNRSAVYLQFVAGHVRFLGNRLSILSISSCSLRSGLPPEPHEFALVSLTFAPRL